LKLFHAFLVHVLPLITMGLFVPTLPILASVAFANLAPVLKQMLPLALLAVPLLNAALKYAMAMARASSKTKTTIRLAIWV
jgi:hypothetical protein